VADGDEGATDQAFERPFPVDRPAVSYVFVFGCQRSGTTILTQLVHAHPHTAIGVERYKYLLNLFRRDGRLDEFGPDLFEPERFFDFRKGDTNIRPPAFAKHYKDVLGRYRKRLVRVTGDKIVPPDASTLLAIERQFPDPRFVFIYRQLAAVAASFARRAADPDDVWPAANDHRAALPTWLAGFEAADRLRDLVGPDRLLPIKYEWLLRPELPVRTTLLAFLELPDDEGSRRRWAIAGTKAEELRGERRPADPEVLAWLEQQDYDRALVDRWDARVRAVLGSATDGLGAGDATGTAPARSFTG
jgi:hypothetical protein